LAEGPHLAEEAFEAGVPMLAMVVRHDEEERFRSLRETGARRGVPCFTVSGPVFESLSATRSPQGILAVCAIRMEKGARWRPKGALVALDGVQDPGNVGAILRTARAAGIAEVALGLGTARPDDAKTVRASQGAIFTVGLWRGDLRLWCRGDKIGGALRLFATRPRGGIAPWTADLTGRMVLLLGGEGSGLDPELDRLADEGLTIPMRSGESLGVAQAAAAILFERVRQEEGSVWDKPGK
jgi:TrmH family RNA methyltransferase